MRGKSGEGLVKNDQSLYDALRQQRASGKTGYGGENGQTQTKYH